MPLKDSIPLDTDESTHDISTAPTTPDGSLTFSPLLQALSLDDGMAFENSLRSENSTHRLVQNVCCVGAGYVGGPTAAILALQNSQIKFTVVDKDTSRINQWNSKHLPIHEPDLPEIIRICRDGSRAFSFSNDPSTENAESSSENISEHTDHVCIPARSPNLFFSDNIEKCLGEADIIMIAVNTPTKTYGIGAGKATDMTAVESVVQDIGKYAKSGAIIVEKSTVPGRTGEFIKDILAILRPNEIFSILSSPEFLSAGSAVQDLLHPDRILIGSSPPHIFNLAAHSLASLYHWIPSQKLIHATTASSELSKLVSNAMLAQRISSINSISAICEAINADIDEVSLAVGLDSRIGGKYLKAGIGFGGSCFKKDIKSLIYLAEGLGLDEVVAYWESVLVVNEWQRRRWVERIVEKMGGGLRGKKVVVLGYTFKRGTGDVRESLAREVIRMLGQERPGEIVVWDDGCGEDVLTEELKDVTSVRVEEDLYMTCERADALLICRELENSTKGESEEVVDPRPFFGFPSEMDLVELRRYLSSHSCAEVDVDDPLGRTYPEPPCEESCAKCEYGKNTNVREEQVIDWKRIVEGMKAPRWIFDGRGVVDRIELEKIGKGVGVEVRVVGVGAGVGRHGW
ncbi:putative udp-glucose 6-dehydrogenase protein [Botrytis fragariae]|uniref:UDP-glucose 6-dehydrogenase n=1 Tax=Botrytis fragariae TaxID=1964551 RepID=A0A8H6AR36_9HELO|nr:putative udp-glucose 6-dehydrogenase protein [Botrytis fragariae]KAF5872261.1 putative udp-glucose 6-dehydrogenase protein [Botrytis fragariae]